MIGKIWPQELIIHYDCVDRDESNEWRGKPFQLGDKTCLKNINLIKIYSNIAYHVENVPNAKNNGTQGKAQFHVSARTNNKIATCTGQQCGSEKTPAPNFQIPIAKMDCICQEKNWETFTEK